MFVVTQTLIPAIWLHKKWQKFADSSRMRLFWKVCEPRLSEHHDLLAWHPQTSYSRTAWKERCMPMNEGHFRIFRTSEGMKLLVLTSVCYSEHLSVWSVWLMYANVCNGLFPELWDISFCHRPRYIYHCISFNSV